MTAKKGAKKIWKKRIVCVAKYAKEKKLTIIMEKWCYKRVEKGASVPKFITNAKSNKNIQLHIAFEPLFSLANFWCCPKINDRYFSVECESISKNMVQMIFLPSKSMEFENCIKRNTNRQLPIANVEQ